MRKILMAGLVAMLGAGQARAVTKPDDMVGVHLFNGIEAKDQHRYFKKWKDIKLSTQTKSALLQKNQAIEKNDGYGIEKFKIHYLFIGGDKVTRVFFLGDGGTVIMMDWPQGQYCKMLFDGDAGFAASIDDACTRLNM